MIVLVPLPTDRAVLSALHARWAPFVAAIASRMGAQASDLIENVYSGLIQIHIAADDVTHETRALAGTRLVDTGSGLTCEWLWMTGTRRGEWVHLLPTLEAWARDQGCVGMKAVCRPGWAKILGANDYRKTHVMMERAL